MTFPSSRFRKLIIDRRTEIGQENSFAAWTFGKILDVGHVLCKLNTQLQLILCIYDIESSGKRTTDKSFSNTLLSQKYLPMKEHTLNRLQ